MNTVPILLDFDDFQTKHMH